MSSRPFLRGRIVRALYFARTESETNELTFSQVHRILDNWNLSTDPDVLESEIDYLADLGLVASRKIDERGKTTLVVKLTPQGVDVHEQTVEAPPGVQVVKLKGEA